VAAIGYGATRLIGEGAEVTDGKSRARKIHTDARPPASADVVVIGGGNIGAATAYFLAKQGLSVVLCEKGAIAGEASGRSVGHASALGVDGPMAPFAAEAYRIWPGMNAELQQETGYRQTGMIQQIRDEASRDHWTKWIADGGEIARRAKVLDGAAAARMIQPYKPWFGAVFDEAAGRAEPTLIAPAFATAAQRLGARIVAPCAVRGLDVAGGRLIGVMTELGVIKTSRAIYAGGAWSSTFMRHIGRHLPTANIFSWCGSFGGVRGLQTGAIFDQVTSRPQLDGNFTGSIMELTMPITPDTFRFSSELYAAWKGGDWPVSPRLGWYSLGEFSGGWSWADDQVSPFERRRILEPTVNHAIVGKCMDQIRKSIPAFRNLQLGEAWGGVISMATDFTPVMGAVPGIAGLSIATAVDGGVLQGPAVGSVMADLIGGKTPRVDLKPFGIDRFQV
jgi:glycine/D-amino acid oxidase-like deaminating enzyme